MLCFASDVVARGMALIAGFHGGGLSGCLHPMINIRFFWLETIRRRCIGLGGEVLQQSANKFEYTSRGGWECGASRNAAHQPCYVYSAGQRN